MRNIILIPSKCLIRFFPSFLAFRFQIKKQVFAFFVYAYSFFNGNKKKYIYNCFIIALFLKVYKYWFRRKIISDLAWFPFFEQYNAIKNIYIIKTQIYQQLVYFVFFMTKEWCINGRTLKTFYFYVIRINEAVNILNYFLWYHDLVFFYSLSLSFSLGFELM